MSPVALSDAGFDHNPLQAAAFKHPPDKNQTGAKLKLTDAVESAGTMVNDNALVRSLKARANWPWIRQHLQRKDIKPGIGWPGILSILGNNDDLAKQTRTALDDYYNSVRLAGNKYVQLFDLTPDIYSAIESTLNNAVVSDSTFLRSYPYVLPEEDLKNAPTDLTLCEVKKIDNHDYCLVFCSRRQYVERQLFENSAAEAITRLIPALSEYSSIVAMKTKSFQAFDLVVIRPSLQRIEVMVDLPLLHPLDVDKVEHSLKLLFAVSLHLPAMKEIAQGQTPINLFPAIDAMYRDNKGGKLQAIRFRTSTGLVDHLRTVVEEDDLRVDTYHSTGAKAINNEVELFELITRIDLTMPAGQVLVRLASSVRILAGPPESRWLHGMDLTNCDSQADSVRAINRVVSFTG